MSVSSDILESNLSEDVPRDHCGVVAVYGVENAAQTIYNSLFALQHRRQKGTGMVVSDGKIMHFCKGMGLVSEVFTGDFTEHLPG